MKRIFLSIICSIWVLSSVLASEKTLNVYKTDGRIQQFVLSSIDRIHIDSSKMLLKVYRTDGALKVIDITSIDSMNYTMEDFTLPEIDLLSASYDYESDKGICIAEVLVDNSSEIHEKGICWSTSNEPVITNFKQAGSVSPGKYFGSMTPLQLGTKYYVRAYVVNAKGTFYSDPMEVETSSGDVTYTLAIDQQQYPEYYQLMKTALDSACYYYNTYTSFKANIYVYYNAGIPTAQANYHGSMGFGPNPSYMWVGTVMHEMAHYFGSGTTTVWQNLMMGGTWKGDIAQALCQQLSGTTLKGDSHGSPIHFWPNGINYRSEVNSATDLINHAKIVNAMLIEDCKLPASW